MSTLAQLVRRSWEQHHLLAVMLELTYRCNLDCVFCYNDLGAKGEPLSLAQYRSLLDELAAMEVLHLTLTGGEPLAHPDFFAIGSHARERGFVVRVKSNGHALRGGLARRLREEVDPFVVDLSLHGANVASHDRQTRVPGSFERLLANIPELQALGLRLKLNATLTRWNEDEIGGMFAIADGFELPLTVNPIVSPRDDGDRSPLALDASLEGKLRFYRLADERASARAGRGEAQREERGAAMDEELAGAPEGYNCGAGTGGLTIDPYGNVLPCVQWRRPVGSLHEASLGEIWRGSQRLAEVRRVNARAGADGPARAAEGFHGHCMGLSELTTGDPLALAAGAVEARDVLREHARRGPRLPVLR
jgi:mycofactocin biosynthetic radical S-adenosylmethionine protein MftC